MPHVHEKLGTIRKHSSKGEKEYLHLQERHENVVIVLVGILDPSSRFERATSACEGKAERTALHTLCLQKAKRFPGPEGPGY